MNNIRQVADIPEVFVTTDGRVFRSVSGVLEERKASRSGERGNQYLRISFYNNGRKFTRAIHRLVAEAFIPNPDNKPQVNHKNGNKFDNRAENLEWVTPAENVQHAFRTGLHDALKGERHNLAKLSNEGVWKIRQLLNQGELSQRQIAKIFGVCQRSVARIKDGSGWKHLVSEDHK